MSRTDAKRLYTRIESLLSSVGHLSESYQQLGGFGQFCTENQLAQWERQLSELSSVKGMRNYWNLSSLYNQLAGDYEQSFYSGTARKALQCLERFCEITEYNGGITPSLYLYVDRLTNLYSVAQDFQRGHKSLYQRVLKRTIELLRLFSLADLQQDNGPDLLVDNATFLWEKHLQLVKTLDGLKYHII